MEALYMLIGFSLVVAVGFLCAFFWAVRSGQFNDKYTPAVRMLFNDDETNPKEKNN
ncbi:MAG: cbb3-type cytochrome oxidase assembly protein CcoS [Ignavibacteriae bacterium]|nr:cbb3-type cytochrome oxidase assembly protein CcoS [Ignavibacteriota bacterium]